MENASYEKFKEIFEKNYCALTEENFENNSKSNEDDAYTIDFQPIYVKSSNKNNGWAEELEEYLNQKRENYDTDVLIWWKLHQKSFPRLAKMARDILCICATSVPIEL